MPTDPELFALVFGAVMVALAAYCIRTMPPRR